MNKEERTKTLINNIKLNINEQNVYEFGLCVEQWKQILDYIGELQKENKKYQEVIEKVIKYIKYCQTSDDDIFPVIEAEKMIEILKGVEE